MSSVTFFGDFDISECRYKAVPKSTELNAAFMFVYDVAL